MRRSGTSFATTSSSRGSGSLRRPLRSAGSLLGWTGPDGMWTTTGPKAWTSGFFPGTLWLAYGATGDGLRAEAEKRLGGLEAQKRDTSGNDQGSSSSAASGTPPG